MSDRAMDAVVIWEEMLTEMNRPDVNDKSVRTIGRWLNNYREANGIAETRQLAVDLAEPADEMWRLFEPSHDSDYPFDWEWIPKWLQALHEISTDFSCTKRWAHIVAGIIASYNMDLDDEEEMSDRFHSLRSFHAEHKMLTHSDIGGQNVEDYREGAENVLAVFWGVYGTDPDNFIMHVCDVRTEEQAREIIKALNFWLKRKTYRIVEEIRGEDRTLFEGLELQDAEEMLTEVLNAGHDAYLQEEEEPL